MLRKIWLNSTEMEKVKLIVHSTEITIITQLQSPVSDESIWIDETDERCLLSGWIDTMDNWKHIV